MASMAGPSRKVIEESDDDCAEAVIDIEGSFDIDIEELRRKALETEERGSIMMENEDNNTEDDVIEEGEVIGYENDSFMEDETENNSDSDDYSDGDDSDYVMNESDNVFSLNPFEIEKFENENEIMNSFVGLLMIRKPEEPVIPVDCPELHKYYPQLQSRSNR